MHSEHLYPLDGGVFGITIPHPGLAAEDFRDLRGMYAFFQPVSGDRVDLLELCTLPWPADRERATMTRQMLAGMREAAAGMPASQQKHMENSIADFTEKLKWLEQDSRKFPDRVSVAANGQVLLAFKRSLGMSSPPERILRLIDPRAGKILFEEKLGGGGGMLGFGGNKKQVAEMLAVSGDGQSALLCFPREGVQAVSLTRGLPKVFTPVVSDANHEYGAWAAGRWLITAGLLERNRLLVLDEQSGKPLHEVALGGTLVEITVSTDGQRAAIGLFGGTTQVIDLDNGKLTTYKPHRGAKRESWCNVALSPDGRFLASWLLDDKWVALTDLETGRTLRWLPLQRKIVRELDGTASVITPGFTFQGSQFITLTQGETVRHDLPIIDGASGFVSQTDHPEFKKPVKYNKKEPLEANLRRFGLTRVANEIGAYWSPALLLKLKRAGKKSLPVGSSRLGGAPDLPADMAWPRWRENPMVFVAQFNLEEVTAAQPSHRLPKTGLLSVFMGLDDGDGMLGMPESKGMWRVLWTPAGTAWQRQTMPAVPDELAVFSRYQEAAITYKPGGYALPQEDSYLVDALQLTPEEQQGYVDLIQQVNQNHPEGQPAHQLLGHPWALQSNDMEMASARASAGEDPFSALLPEDPGYAEWLRRAAGWQLLLQLGSDESQTNMLWGDAGLYYWFIPRANLFQQNFDETWGLLQT